MVHFEDWFQQVCDGRTPWSWQIALGMQAQCTDRLIRIPTGMGKTLGVLSAWGFNRVMQGNPDWPRRLVWCLPMRTLVEQTAAEAELFLRRAGLSDQVDIYKLQGGLEEVRWFDAPERLAILVGTQDMLLSRALNRGYAMGRAAWPRAFGLINTDVLWVMDEVQLMGVGLTTGTQIQSFWQHERHHNGVGTPPRATWWMSATLQRSWVQTADTPTPHNSPTTETVSIPPQQRTGPTWEAQKPITYRPAPTDEWGGFIAERHAEHLPDPTTGRQTLVIVNTVKTATQLFEFVSKLYHKTTNPPEIHLLHSRFRPYERRDWSRFLHRSASNAATNRILIATQVVEAGVDISASCLITELAPWSSLVQRFGRAARYGGVADVVILDSQPSDEKKAAPYSLTELNAAKHALMRLAEQQADVSIRSLEQFEEQLQRESPASLSELYPYCPLHVLLQHEFAELFDTSADLTGADLDVGRFIREGEERDLQVFWREWDRVPGDEIVPTAEELCSVPVGDAKAWIKKIAAQRGTAFVWDYLDGRWVSVRPEALRPGMVLLINAKAGGYDPTVGFTGQPLKKGQTSLDIGQPAEEPENFGVVADTAAADQMESSEGLSQQPSWKTILTHSREARDIANQLSEALHLPDQLRSLVDLALRLHDWGKAHPAFASGTYRVQPPRTDLAKAPAAAWRTGSQLYWTRSHGHRRGFRHELASCLAILELIRRTHPQHPAVYSAEYACLWEGAGDVVDDDQLSANSISDELKHLSPLDVDLLLFLIAAHHGKVRLSMQSSPKDQDFDAENVSWWGTGMPIRGVRHGDEMLPVRLPDRFGQAVELPAVTLHLDVAAIGLSEQYGRSWTERMGELVQHYGPFTLGYLEAIVRAADVRASQLTTADTELVGLCLEVGTSETTSDSTVAEDDSDSDSDQLDSDQETPVEEEADV